MSVPTLLEASALLLDVLVVLKSLALYAALFDTSAFLDIVGRIVFVTRSMLCWDPGGNLSLVRPTGRPSANWHRTQARSLRQGKNCIATLRGQSTCKGCGSCRYKSPWHLTVVQGLIIKVGLRLWNGRRHRLQGWQSLFLVHGELLGTDRSQPHGLLLTLETCVCTTRKEHCCGLRNDVISSCCDFAGSRGLVQTGTSSFSLAAEHLEFGATLACA